MLLYLINPIYSCLIYLLGVGSSCVAPRVFLSSALVAAAAARTPPCRLAQDKGYDYYHEYYYYYYIIISSSSSIIIIIIIIIVWRKTKVVLVKVVS